MSRAITRLLRKASVKTRLRAFLDANEPQLVQFLQTLWQSQGRAITYKEIREAILSGEFADGRTGGSFEGHEGANGYYAEKWLNEWRQDYSRFVTSVLQPEWEAAMTSAAREIPGFFPGRDLTNWRYNPADAGVQRWMRTHGAVFVTNSTQTQLDGLKAVLRHASAGGMNVDELSRYVRPMVGLTRDQYAANLRYYNTLRENGMSEQKALDKAIRYGQQQHRYRGYNIARTELAFAYNHGALDGVKQAQTQGFIGAVEKYWSSAADERMCPICRDLDGVSLGLDEEFGHTDKHGVWVPINPRLTERETKLVPPAHPSCRCAIGFNELKPDELGYVPPETTASEVDVITEFTTDEVRLTPTVNPSEIDVITEIDADGKGSISQNENPPSAAENVPYTDITSLWYANAKPNSHAVQDLQSYTVNGVTYTVDGRNVVLDYSIHEKEIAELLERKVGGEIFMVPRVNNPQGVRTPDYLFHGRGYDLKTLGESAGANTMFNRVKKAKGQTACFIIDITKTHLDDDTVDQQIKKIFRDKETQFVKEVIIIRGEEINMVAKRS